MFQITCHEAERNDQFLASGPFEIMTMIHNKAGGVKNLAQSAQGAVVILDALLPSE